MSNPAFRQWKLYPELIHDRLSGLLFDETMFQGTYRDQMRLLIPFISKLGVKLNAAAIEVIDSENAFLSNGRPYFKLWPAILDQISKTSLEIDSSFLHFPYNTIEVRIPRDHLMAKSCGSSWIATLITNDDALKSSDRIEQFTGKPFNEVWEDDVRCKLRIIANLPGDSADHDSTLMVIKRGETLQDAIEGMVGIIETSAGKQERPGAVPLRMEWLEFMFRVTVATAFFAVDMHELVAPDVKRNIVFRDRLGKLKAKKNANRMFEKNKRWLVGSEIDLPRDLVVTNGTKAVERGNELSQGHFRSGHMRMQPCGEGLKDRKLIFIAPTWVRPDLPTAATHGYRIGKPKKSKIGC